MTSSLMILTFIFINKLYRFHPFHRSFFITLFIFFTYLFFFIPTIYFISEFYPPLALFIYRITDVSTKAIALMMAIIKRLVISSLFLEIIVRSKTLFKAIKISRQS